MASYLRKKKAALIFCPTKNLCEQVAKKLANQLPIQYPDYKVQDKTTVTYTDVDNEVRDMIQYLVKNNKSRYFDRNEVYDPSIQA